MIESSARRRATGSPTARHAATVTTESCAALLRDPARAVELQSARSASQRLKIAAEVERGAIVCEAALARAIEGSLSKNFGDGGVKPATEGKTRGGVLH